MQAMMCSVCKYGLTYFTPDGLIGAWYHPSGIEEQDHAPVPVPVDYAQLQGVCDFCSGPKPVRVYSTTPAANRTRTAGGGRRTVSAGAERRGTSRSGREGGKGQSSTREDRRGSFGEPRSERHIDQESDLLWSTCAECVPLVEAGDTWGLVSRVAVTTKLRGRRLAEERGRVATDLQITLDAIIPGSGRDL